MPLWLLISLQQVTCGCLSLGFHVSCTSASQTYDSCWLHAAATQAVQCIAQVAVQLVGVQQVLCAHLCGADGLNKLQQSELDTFKVPLDACAHTNKTASRWDLCSCRVASDFASCDISLQFSSAPQSTTYAACVKKDFNAMLL